jgi:HAD superfamily hydrolase (TIGR01457 family)
MVLGIIMKELIDELRHIKLAIFDLDGVIYRGTSLIKDVDNVIQKLKSNSIEVVYNSNNSTATRDMYTKRLASMNIPSKREDFYTSASITAAELSKIKPNSLVYVIGEMGLKEELIIEGHTISDQTDFNSIDFIIVGLDRDFKYEKIVFAQKCLLDGKAQFYATNSDATLPIENGFLPGAGVMVQAIETCTGQKPIKIFGKPSPYGIKKILKDKNISPKNAAIFGDRLNTDIAAGNSAGIMTILLLTGVTSKDMLENLETDVKPDLVLTNLKEIFLD